MAHPNEILLVRRGSTGLFIASPELVALTRHTLTPEQNGALGVQIARQTLDTDGEVQSLLSMSVNE